MNSFLTIPGAPRSESLAFLSLSANDLECLKESVPSSRNTRTFDNCQTSKVSTLTDEDKARIALCEVIESLSESKSEDEFVARRDRLFPRYADLMLGLGRIVHALTDRAQLNSRLKSQLAMIEKFISAADDSLCPPYLKDQALFSLWELGKVVDLADFIQSRPPLPEAKREEDFRLSLVCTMELLFGRFHLDCLMYGIGAKEPHCDDVRELLSEGMRHFVNGHIAIRLGAQLRQELREEESIAMLPVDEEDRFHLAHAMALQGDQEY